MRSRWCGKINGQEVRLALVLARLAANASGAKLEPGRPEFNFQLLGAGGRKAERQQSRESVSVSEPNDLRPGRCA